MPSSTTPSLSILLPTFNGEPDLERLLPALAAQEAVGELQLVAIDSSSTDRSLELLARAGAEVQVIPRAEFGHGTTRNALAKMARGEILVFLSQDALPADKHFLAELTAPFEDPQVAGSYGRILPRPDTDPLAARTVLAAPEARAEDLTRELEDVDAIWSLPGDQRACHLRFNNVASAVRAPVFADIEFPELPFGEDFAWAARALNAGWKIRFAPRAVALHAHVYTPRQAFARYAIDAAFHREIHGHLLRPNLASVARGLAFELREDARYLWPRMGLWGLSWHMLRAPGLRGAQILGQWWGSCSYGQAFWPEEGPDQGGSSR
ncbi:MAG: glycosyltransferase [bacterium]|jgi:rhamnosyltransferase